MVSSSDVSAKKGGILAINCLIGANVGNINTRTIRFANYLRNLLPSNDVGVMKLAAKTVGWLALVSGSYTAELCGSHGAAQLVAGSGGKNDVLSLISRIKTNIVSKWSASSQNLATVKTNQYPAHESVSCRRLMLKKLNEISVEVINQRITRNQHIQMALMHGGLQQGEIRPAQAEGVSEPPAHDPWSWLLNSVPIPRLWISLTSPFLCVLAKHNQAKNTPTYSWCTKIFVYQCISICIGLKSEYLLRCI